MLIERKLYVSVLCTVLISVCLFSSALAFGVEKPVLEILPEVIDNQGKNTLLNLLEMVYGGNNEEMLKGFYNTDVAPIFC